MAGIADDIAAVAEKLAEKKTAETKKSIRARVRDTGEHVLEFLDRRLQVDITHLPETAYERLVGREPELKRLDEAWAEARTNIISLIAEGGAGKSALVNEWLMRLQADNYRGSRAVLGWSFYSQGSKERATAADEFLNWALDKLGIKLETTSATAKGEAIAEAMMQRRMLMVLDGLEPLQHGPGPQLGQLKDLGLRALLRRFAVTTAGEKHGLVVLTSRLAIKDIARWHGGASPVLDVERLSAEAGAAVLRDNGVWGTDNELKAAVHDFEGHPLALGLLASLLRETQTGDARRRNRIRGLLADIENPGHDHARRVMDSYVKDWLAGRPVLLDIMHLVGLFDRPASADLLRALRKKPAIKGLTDEIVRLKESQWQRAIAQLRAVRLLAPSDSLAPDALDAHPLVREWFGQRLREAHADAWRSGHFVIYDHLRRTTHESDTPTLEEILLPLYQAIAHGCHAGKHQEVLRRIYMNRICRRGKDGELMFYAFHNLGAIGTNLAALYWLFESAYEIPVSTISEEDQFWVLGEAAFCLHSQGRLSEAVAGERRALQRLLTQKHWKNASQVAINLSDAELLLGNLSAAIAAARKAVECADLANERRHGMNVTVRGALASALRMVGNYVEAKNVFADAERRHAELYSTYPQLYSLVGYYHLDMLLDQQDWAVSSARAEKLLEWEVKADPLFDQALVRLGLGRSNLGKALATLDSSGVATAGIAHAASIHLNEAVDGVRAANIRSHSHHFLLARAAFHRSLENWAGGTRDLDEGAAACTFLFDACPLRPRKRAATSPAARGRMVPHFSQSKNWWVTPELAFGPRCARTRWANPPYKNFIPPRSPSPPSPSPGRWRWNRPSRARSRSGRAPRRPAGTHRRRRCSPGA
jgi:tetratricopeptide (TPR) repeat protein